MIRPLNDWVLVELEPVKDVYSSGIIRVAAEPIRTARVLRVGPGKHYPDKFVATVVREGQRVAFFSASTETKQGQQLNFVLKENQELIREVDVLLVLEGNVEVSR